MKPDWEYAPEWANFLACDCNGSWFWYENKPMCGDGEFIAAKRGKFELASSFDWSESLESRP